MENTGLKGLGITLYQRVILSYKTTLIGLAVVAIGQIVDYYAASPNKVISTICALAGAVLVVIKEKYPAPTPPTP